MDKQVAMDEQETVIIFQPARINKVADVYTCMPDQMKKLRDLSESRPDCVQIKLDQGDAVFAEVERSCIRITPKRLVSEEQRRSASERMKKVRAETNDTE